MIKNILNLKGAQPLTNDQQKMIKGGTLRHPRSPNHCDTYVENVPDGCECGPYVGCLDSGSSCTNGICTAA